eukprot:gnl/Spiro4/17654_TR9392_c0_g1_i1.p1 gnl/Spiro4/17654_TR9392_c0_g1~~gnl/Spiro4/17654_TR9392_c0_g1_i1.p1  ORF type:complete len:440 (+),score=123.36 gnl/Spiro4/17654_TR9392_c0_g1_i1:56-1375(+)
MISAILFINARGEVVINRFYRSNVSRNVAEMFRSQVILSKEVLPPIIFHNDISYLYIRHENLFIVAITKSNANAASVFRFLHKLVDVFKSYFEHKFDEDVVRKNFSVAHELLDETMDFGHPQTTDPNVLKLFIHSKEFSNSFAPAPEQITIQATGVVNWRKPGIKYKKNEVFIDVVENVNALMSSSGGDILRADVFGKVIIKCYLSGMPECKLGLNDKVIYEGDRAARNNRPGAPSQDVLANLGVELDDVTFDQCVRLSKFDAERSITFIPMDGTFELMSYRVTQNINVPFRVIPSVKKLNRTRYEIHVHVSALFHCMHMATNVVISIPVPKTTATAKTTQTLGTSAYVAKENAILWTVAKFPGASEHHLSAEVDLLSTFNRTEKTWSRPPIAMQFTVPMYTASGLRVEYMKVLEKSCYTSVKWVRYITKAGAYQIRTT